jgi:hypothetical protein
MVGIGKTFTGAFVVSAALATALFIAHDPPTNANEPPYYDAMGTFNTEHLAVAESSTMGSNLAAGGSVLAFKSKTAGVAPLDVIGGTTNTWDMSVMTGSNTDPATFTFFAHTPTTTPSVDSSLAVKIIPGDHGAGGVYLRPNGPSFFDPDGYAVNGKILALGFTVPDYELDVRDNGNTRTSATDCVNDGSELACRIVNAAGNGMMDTGTHNTSYEGVTATAIEARSAGTGTLTNRAIRATAANGTSNYAMWTDNGDVWVDQGNVTVHTGSTALKALTCTTAHASGQINSDASIVAAINVVATAGKLESAAEVDFGNGSLFGGSSFMDIYIPSASNVTTALDASGTGSVDINSNDDGISNAGTGGLRVFGGNNSSTVQFAVKANGHLRTGGTAVSLTNATCASSVCTDLAGTIATTSTSATITFANTYTGAHDATCVVMPQGTATYPTCTVSATAITCTTVLNTTNYNYICISNQ